MSRALWRFSNKKKRFRQFLALLVLCCLLSCCFRTYRLIVWQPSSGCISCFMTGFYFRFSQAVIIAYKSTIEFKLMDMLYSYTNVAILVYYISIEYFARFWPPLAFDRINNAFNLVSILFIILLEYILVHDKSDQSGLGGWHPVCCLCCCCCCFCFWRCLG